MTIRQRLFVKKYLKYGNATLAAMDMYSCKNKKSAAVIGSRLLRNVNVIGAIEGYYEAEESIPVLMVKTIKQMLEGDDQREKAKAIKMVMRLYGYY